MKIHRGFLGVAIVAAMCLAGGGQAQAMGAADDHTVLILDATVSGGASSPEAQAAVAAGYSVEVADDSQWGAKSAADFATYRALILGDATCTGLYVTAAAEANKNVWGPVVDGNVILVGTDPVFHYGQGGSSLTNGAVTYAGAQPGKTGAYICLSCYYHGTPEMTPVPLLDPFGAFSLRGVDCYNNAHVVASHPALTGITDSTLSNWSCSVHEAFDGWPAGFQPLAIARDIGSSFTASDGSVGTPYIMARGQVTALGLSLSPATATNLVNTNHTVTATLTDSNSSPVVGALLGFQVTSGPNTGTTGTCAPANCLTDANGQATWTYLGDGGVGDDVIKAFQDTIANNMPDAGEPQTTALKTWTTCGDGTIQEGETCDPAAAPSGCSGVLSCRSDCQCGCIRDSDCDDGNSCTSDTCNTSTGSCSHADAAPLPESCGGCCQFGVGLTARIVPSSSCSNGVGQFACAGEGGTFVADGACNAGSGLCETAVCGNGLVESGEDCDPGTSGLDSCCNTTTCRYEPSGTACTDDNDVCTDDQCDNAGMCQHPANTAPCDDGDQCTGPDLCGDGVCGGAPVVPPSCDDNEVCTDDGCSLNQCTHSNNTASCEDGQFCTVNDICGGGTCQPGTARDCNQGVTCSTGSCNEELNQCDTIPDPEQDGNDCDDSDVCTNGTTCSGGACGGGTTLNCDDSDTCTTDSCDPVQGCLNPTTVESRACDSCEDGIDNDDVGGTDYQDCSCNLLCDSFDYGVIGTRTTSMRTVYMGQDTHVSSVAVSGGAGFTSRASVCAERELALVSAVTIDGAAAARQNSIFGTGSDMHLGFFAGRVPPGLLTTTAIPPIVGPGTLTLTDPANLFPAGSVDLSGTHEEYTDCGLAIQSLQTEGDALLALTPTVELGAVTHGVGDPPIVVSGPGPHVLHMSRLRVRMGASLEVDGDADSVVIVQIDRTLSVAQRASVQVGGGLMPSKLIWVVDRSGRVYIGSDDVEAANDGDAAFAGTVLAPARKIVVGKRSRIAGALLARKVQLNGYAVISHHPFTGVGP